MVRMRSGRMDTDDSNIEGNIIIVVVEVEVIGRDIAWSCRVVCQKLICYVEVRHWSRNEEDIHLSMISD